MKIMVNLAGLFIAPFQLILDINAQLSNPSDAIAKRALMPFCELNTTNDWINLEALGNPVALRANQLHGLLLESLREHAIHPLELHIYCGDTDIGIDNIFSLLYLADAIPTNIFVYTDNSAKLQAQLNALESRQKLQLQFQKNRVPEDENLKEKLSWLKSQRQKILQKKNFPINDEYLAETEISLTNMGMIIGYSWTCLKAGAYSIGCNIIEYILNKANVQGIVKEQLFMHLQLIRFLSHQYEKVTQQPFPESFQYLTASDSTNLYFIKAYAATLSRNLPVAETFFKKAKVDSSLPMTDEVSLFRLNLHALFLVLSGNVVAALSQEHQIEEYIATNAINTLGLKYVNYINIARVYKKLKQFDTSLDYYKKAYQEIKGGGFTDSDHIYYNMNLGGLFEAAGQAEKALFYWVKAALHWLTFENPYALAWRPRVILCGEKVTEILPPLDADRIHQFLFDKINQLLKQTHFSLENLPERRFIFIHANEENSTKESCYLAENIIVYRCKKTELTSKKRTAKAEALQCLVAQILGKILGLEDENLILQVDNHLEDAYPDSAEDCLNLAILSACNQFYYQGQYIQFNVEHITHYFANAKMKLSTVIDSLQETEEGLELQYRRSFLNQRLNAQDEILVLKKYADKNTAELPKNDIASVKILSRLMQARILIEA